jgi:acyl carrier protein
VTDTPARILRLIREHFGTAGYPGSSGGIVDAALSLDTPLDARFVTDLGLDSLDLVELTMATEEEFSVEISDDEMAALVGSTARGLAEVVDAKLAAAGKVAAA